ncbi:MAG: metal-dependent hydrolase [Gammaproteobacteria bacterium]|nr:MAG: metal-dependent hydrolase [Gammaproteobacteria bacterium]
MKILQAILLISVFFISLVGYAETKNNDHLLPFEGKHIVDFHVHVAGLGYGNSGCFINDEMRNNFRFRFYLMAMGTSLKELESEGDQIVLKKISNSVSTSKVVDKAVILSLDGVIDARGELDKAKTQIYVPNEYVYEQTRRYSNLLYAASINPYRKDAIERLEHAKTQGAVLVKWIPSIMYINPADPAIIPFYKKMAELDIPLLTHTGMEKSFSHAKDELADPHRLQLPLSLGVKVIAAHIATTGESDGEENFERILPMFKQYPNLYGDISSLTQINKLGYVEKVLKHPELEGRLIYGTDWPLQFFPLISPWYHLDQLSVADAFAISRIKNQWDRDVALKIGMGLDKRVFHEGSDLFLQQ